MKAIATIIGLSVFICFSQFVLAQQDNGNHFEMSWSADLDTFYGGQGKGLVAYAGFDLDQDGRKEFVVFDKFQGFGSYDAVKLFEAVGDNDFHLVWEHHYVQDPDDEGHGLTIADLDEDGMEELLVAAEDAIYIYEWDGTTFESGGGLPQEPTLTFYPIPDNNGDALVRQLWIVNLDDDPEKELFMGYWGEAGMYCAIASLPNKDFSNPDWKDEFADNWKWRVGGICIADFDGDGKIDIWTSHFDDQPATRVYENDGPDTYVIKYTTTPSTLIMYPSFDSTIANGIFYDFDGDGNGELLITDSHGKMFIITKESSNNFTEFGPSAWKYVLHLPGVRMNGFVRSGFMGDLDRDGKPDIYYNDFTAKAVFDLEYQGGAVTDSTNWIPYAIYKGHRLVYGYIYPSDDLDGDGKGEIVIAGNGDPVANLQIIENQDAPSAVTEPFENLPNEYALYQNFPNPFNSRTTIKYVLSKPSDVMLRVFNSLGQVVKILTEKRQSAGRYRIVWDATDQKGRPVSSGLYFYKLEAGDYTDLHKMLLMK